MSRLTICAAAFTALFVVGLTACSSDPSIGAVGDGEVVSDASPENRIDARWEEATSRDTELSLTLDAVLVDPDGDELPGEFQEQSAGHPDRPATIAANGNIYVIVYSRSDLKILDTPHGYITDAPDGKPGPELECETYDPEPPQLFECRAQFKDEDYASGTYYAVMTAEGAGKEAGTASLVVPFYTQPSGGE